MKQQGSRGRQEALVDSLLIWSPLCWQGAFRGKECKIFKELVCRNSEYLADIDAS